MVKKPHDENQMHLVMKHTSPRHFLAVSALMSLLCCPQPSRGEDPVVYSVNPAKVERTASIGVYGQFLEHIFNSVHGGLWADMILNPSLEPNGSGWVLKDEAVTLRGCEYNKPLCFGDSTWKDYDLSLDARRDDGSEGFVVMFRVDDESDYQAIFGGIGNKEHRITKNGKPLGKLRVSGSIEKGEWHNVKISCRQAKFTVSLDGKAVFEFEDKDQPLLHGKIGLNVLHTRASYRNVKVTAPDGNLLLARLPTTEEMITLPAYWKLSGSQIGSAFTEKEGAFNDATSLVLRGTATGGECGLRQGPKCLVKGETYRGSLWLRSPRGYSAAVRMRDAAGTIIFEKAFDQLPPEWSKREFSFEAPADTPDAVFEVVSKGEGQVSVDMINLFSQSALAVGGFRPDLLAAIKDIKPATIRYPGGSFVYNYRWKDAVGPREKRRYYPTEIWEDRDANQFGTDEFMELCRRTGAEPVIAVNIKRSVVEAVEWLEYCNGAADTAWGKVRAANGHPEPYNVKIWEIGNEEWVMGLEKYAAALTKFANALKAKDPSIQIGACGAYAFDNGPSHCNGWNKALLDAAAKEIDLLSIHYYNGIGQAQDYAGDPRQYEEYIRDQIGALIRNSANPRMKVYCSEWGQMNIDWTSGLYAGGLLNGFERLGGELMGMSCPAVWLQAVKSRSNPAPRWLSSHILFDHRSWCPVPVYVVQKLWREHFGPKIVHLDGPKGPLNVVASTTEDGRTIFFKAVNPTDKECEVELKVAGAFKVATAELQVIAPGELKARNTLDEPERIVRSANPVNIAGQTLRFKLPALAAGAIRVNL